MAPDRGVAEDSVSQTTGRDVMAGTKVVQAVHKAKMPPPESTTDIWNRRWIVLSFWVIVLFLGLPIWWKTTTVYRSELPYKEMHDWAEGRKCEAVFPLKIVLKAPAVSQLEASHLLRLTQHALDDLNEFSAHHLRLTLYDSSSPPLRDEALTVELSPSDEQSTPTSSLKRHSTVLAVSYAPSMLPSLSATSSSLAAHIATELQQTFVEESATIAHLITNNPGKYPSSRALNPDFIAMLDERKTRAMKYAPTYHVTFSLLSPGATPSNWEIEAALQDTFLPLLRALAPLGNFTVESQVHPYAQLAPSVHPSYDDEAQAWLLDDKDLGGFINAAEWPLNPSIGEGSTINFLLYIPSAAHAPLRIRGTTASGSAPQSWLVPQWGSVYVLNPNQTHQSKLSSLSKDDLQTPILAFSTHLLSLLGLPSSPATSLPVRLQTLSRILTLNLLHSSSATLGALARLTASLPSIAIPPPVAASVDKALVSLDGTCSALRRGEFGEALRQAREADGAAERAFFEKSMVGQVYFPDEHKVAVYLPLLGPVAVPLILGLLRELKTFIAFLKSRRK